MDGFVKGDVVVVPFPFSNLRNSKRRPALVVSKLIGDDVILCQITSQTRLDGYSIRLLDSDFVIGGINQESNIRPNHLFTAESSIISKCAGKLKPEKICEVVDKIIEIISA